MDDKSLTEFLDQRDAAIRNAAQAPLRATLHHIGAMVYMDRHGNIKFKPDYGPEDMLNAVNAALEVQPTA